MKKIEERYVGFALEPEFAKDQRASSSEKEAVDHPAHYNKGIEVIDYIDSWDFNFTIGNII